MYTRRTFGALSALAGLTALAGCSSSGSSSSPTASGSAGASSAAAGSAGSGSGSPVTLQFWTWATNISQVVALWNKANPDIQVKVNSQSQGDALYTKLLTAAKAGNPPDMAQVEYQALPSMITAGVPADISSAASSLKSKFDPSIYNLVSFSGALYGIPQDTAPMLLLYRADLFTKYGLKVPTTWDEYATTAAQLRTKDPTKYLTTFSSGDPGWFSGLAAQAGAKWWSTSGTSWKVGIDDAPSKKVASYWQGLVESGAVQGQPMYTPQWNKDLNDGTLLSWPTAVWGPGVLEGIAPATKGKWASAPLPAWTAGDAASGQWGGSSDIVCAKSPHQAEALKFLTWLNTDPQAVTAMITTGALYPADVSSQSSSALAAAPAFLPAEKDFFANAKKIGTTVNTFTWGPDVTVTYSTYTDAFGAAIQKKSSFSGALETMQSTTVADMKKSGFTVASS